MKKYMKFSCRIVAFLVKYSYCKGKKGAYEYKNQYCRCAGVSFTKRRIGSDHRKWAGGNLRRFAVDLLDHFQDIPDVIEWRTPYKPDQALPRVKKLSSPEEAIRQIVRITEEKRPWFAVWCIRAKGSMRKAVSWRSSAFISERFWVWNCLVPT